MKGKNCGVNCKHFHGTCDFDENGGLKFIECCDIHNDKFLEFQRKYGKKICAWVDENIIMPCFEPTENTEVLNKLDETLTKILNDYDKRAEIKDNYKQYIEDWNENYILRRSKTLIDEEINNIKRIGLYDGE